MKCSVCSSSYQKIPFVLERKLICSCSTMEDTYLVRRRKKSTLRNILYFLVFPTVIYFFSYAKDMKMLIPIVLVAGVYLIELLVNFVEYKKHSS
ncbi:MAG: hypothetical protein HQK53_18965 [Oligoflexia bacterium]|nr:hypothetical protein [Oligoflexia bacterium]